MKLRALLIVATIGATVMLGTGVAGASSAQTEHFTAMGTSFDEPMTLVGVGPLSATGTNEPVAIHRDNFVFPDGTVAIKHFTTTTKDTYDGSTCTGSHRETGTYVIAKGTGAYSHATGSGNYKVTAYFQGCGATRSESIVIQAHGPLTLG